MTKLCFVLAAMLMTYVAPAAGQDHAVSPPVDAKPAPTKATYLVTGLHCPPCTRTVESSLAGAKGILAIKVDWKTKTAHIEFDETVLPAQEVSSLIAGTPHLMGGSLHYAGWLELRAPEIKDETSGQRAEKALMAVDGIKSAKAYPNQHAVAVYFGDKGKVTTQELVDSLKLAGFQAENL